MGKVIEKDGFSLVTYNEVDWHMLINDSNMLTAKGYMLDNNIKKIQLNYTAGFTQETTDFLELYSFVDEITIIPAGNVNISGIHYLQNLREFRITKAVKQVIQFKLFPLLQACSLIWSSKQKDLQFCTSLEELSIFNYNAEDLTGLINLVNLERLKIGNSNLKYLSGVEAFKKLKSLSLSYNTKLSSLKGIEVLSNSLKILDIEACKSIASISEIAMLANLEKLGLNNCGEIASIKPIEHLKKIRRFDFWETTNIINGDVAPCIGIRQVAFQNRKHYNYTNEQIDKFNLTKSR